MSQPKSEAPHLHLERARDREGCSRTAWCADYGRGESRPGGGGGESHRSQRSLPSPSKCTKTAKKRAVLRTLWLINRQ
jgi:hypothetical protein